MFLNRLIFLVPIDDDNSIAFDVTFAPGLTGDEAEAFRQWRRPRLNAGDDMEKTLDMPLVRDGPVLYCLTPGVRRLALLASTDASGQDQERGIDDAVSLPANRDMTIVAREHFAPADVSVAAQMSRIKAANPQALLILTVGTPLATALRALSDSGLDLPVFTSNGNST